MGIKGEKNPFKEAERIFGLSGRKNHQIKFEIRKSRKKRILKRSVKKNEQISSLDQLQLDQLVPMLVQRKYQNSVINPYLKMEEGISYQMIVNN